MHTMQITELTRDLAKHEEAGEYLQVIEGVRELVAPTRRRSRISGSRDGSVAAGATSSCRKPSRTNKPSSSRRNHRFARCRCPRGSRRRIHGRRLPSASSDVPNSEWQAEMPAAQYDTIENTTLMLCGGLVTGLLHSEAHVFPWKPNASTRSEAGEPSARMCT